MRRSRLRLSALLVTPTLVAAATWIACSSFDAATSPALEDGGPDARGDSSPTDATSVDSPATDDAGDATAPCADAGVVAHVGCPVPIANGQLDPRHVLVVNGKLFWSNFGSASNAGNVMSAQLDGANASEFVATSNGYHPKFLASHGSYVYWGEQAPFDEANAQGDVHRQLAGGGAIETLASPYTPRGIAADDKRAYWVTWNGQVIAHDLDSGLNATWGNGLVNPIGIDVDDAGVVVAIGGNETSNPGAIQGFSDGGVSAPFGAPRPTLPSGVRLDGNDVYWAEQGKQDAGATGSINRVGRFGAGSPAVLCQAQASAQFIALSISYVYFTAAGLGANDGELRRVRKDGTGPCELLVSGLARPEGIDVYSRYVYWTTRGDGRVWRLQLF